MLTLSTVNNETHVGGYGSTVVLWRDDSDHR
jgi:hypothetical protein